MLLAAIVLIAAALRAYALYIRGALDYDETYYYILGHNLFAGKGYTLNGLPHTAFPPLYPIFVGLAGLFTDSRPRGDVLGIARRGGAPAGAGLLPGAGDVRQAGRGGLGGGGGGVAGAILLRRQKRPLRPADVRGVGAALRDALRDGHPFMWLAARRESLRYTGAAGVLRSFGPHAKRSDRNVRLPLLCGFSSTAYFSLHCHGSSGPRRWPSSWRGSSWRSRRFSSTSTQ